jgi:hypothetical protein
MFITESERREKETKERLNAEMREAIAKAKDVSMTVDGMFFLCRVCSKLSKLGDDPKAKAIYVKDLTKSEARAAKRLIKDGLLRTDQEGLLVPTTVGFLSVRNLAPVPTAVLKQMEDAMKS